jgi:phage regulator Rha-like protein
VSNLRSKNINRKKLTAIKSVVPSESIMNRILVIRDQKVILDKDLAKLYGVETRALKQAVKRNLKRFPLDFMFILNGKEINSLVSQNVIPSKSYLGGAKPYVFTEQGVAMLSSVLNSERAIEINVLIMRAFVKLREIISTHKKVEQKLKEIENKLQDHEEQIVQIIEVINELLASPPAEKKKIGFTIDD